jgi:hypothetical protein
LKHLYLSLFLGGATEYLVAFALFNVYIFVTTLQVPRMEKRVHTVAKLGYKMCVIPKSAEKSLANLGFQGMKIVGCKNLKEVINTVFKA